MSLPPRPRGAQQIAMLTFDLGVNQRLARRRHVASSRQCAVLADAALDLAGRGHQAGRVVAAKRDPVDADAVIDAAAQRLGG